MNVLTTLTLALAVLCSSGQDSSATAADAAKSSPALTRFDFQQPGRKPDHWVIALDEKGAGKYEDLSGAEQGPAGAVRQLRVGEATRMRLNAGYPAVIAAKCETKEKNIAKTGAKQVAYSLRDGAPWSDCTFNYSDDQKLNDVASAFQAIAATIQAGDKLKHKHRFDHLGLDAELDSLIAAVKQGYAIEVQNIAPILQSIVDDEEIMSPSRRKAKTLLELSTVPAPVPAVASDQAAPSTR